MVSPLAGSHIVSTLLYVGAVSLLFIEIAHINSLDSGLLETNLLKGREGVFPGTNLKEAV